MAGEHVRRGDRRVLRIDFATAAWERNQHGVDMLVLSLDPASGAVTFALRTPAALVYPEHQHFYDCDEELFQFEGEFHHDRLLPYREGDYVFRPAGTVYGDDEGSEGGLIVASLARKPVRFHFDDHPKPWRGHYRVDRMWNDGRTDPFLTSTATLAWTAAPAHQGIDIKPLRGMPGVASRTDGASMHSPWAADAAFMLRLPAGYDGPFPSWPGAALETLVTDGHARTESAEWYRGCYSFDGLAGRCRVDRDLVLYVRSFEGRGSKRSGRPFSTSC